MPREDFDVVLRTVELYNRGDPEGAIELWAPDAVWDWSNSRGFDAGVYRGRAEILAFWHRMLETFEEVRVEILEIVEVADELLLVDNIGHVRGRDGIEAQARSSWLTEFRGGEQVALTLYQTKEEALEAAGRRQAGQSSQPK